MSAIPPLPPTGLQRQAASAVRPIGAGGSVNPSNPQQRPSTQQQGGQQGAVPGAPQAPAPSGSGAGTALQATSPSAPPATRGSTSLRTLADQLSRQLGLPIGQNGLVDEQGNFLQTPDQIAQQSGGAITMGAAAARMNLIADAIQRNQQERQTQKSVAALQAGLGQVQSRGRGSLAAIQSGFYQGLSQLYQSQQYEAADFSYFIQKEQLDMQMDMIRRAERLQKKNSRFGTIAGIGLGIAGIATANPALAIGGFSSAAGNAGSSGWF